MLFLLVSLKCCSFCPASGMLRAQVWTTLAGFLCGLQGPNSGHLEHLSLPLLSSAGFTVKAVICTLQTEKPGAGEELRLEPPYVS